MNLDWNAIIPVSIAVTGWVVSHYLTLRAQNRALPNQLLNTDYLSLFPECTEIPISLQERSRQLLEMLSKLHADSHTYQAINNLADRNSIIHKNPCSCTLTE